MVEVEIISSDDRERLKQTMSEAYLNVLAPCFEEINAPIEDTFSSLADVSDFNPNAKSHLIIARQDGAVVGATFFVTYSDTNTVFWIYEGVLKESRKNNIATTMHDMMDSHLSMFFNNSPYSLFAELSKLDRIKLYEKLESLGLRELALDYQDALGDPRWALCVKKIGVGGHPGEVTKEELRKLLKSNREIAIDKRFDSAEEERADPVMQFNLKALDNVPGDTVPVHKTPFRFRNKDHRDFDLRSCPDSF